MEKKIVKPIPDGYHTLTPFLMVNEGEKMLAFIKDAFGATVHTLHKTPEGKIMHAELQIGDSRLMLAEGSEKYPTVPGMIYVYVEDCDAVHKSAVQAGGTSLREPTDEFYGDRSCGIKDMSGNQWWIATHIEDVSQEEIQRRESEWRKQQGA